MHGYGHTFLHIPEAFRWADCVAFFPLGAQGTHLAVGTNKGVVQQWDVAKRTKIREFGGHVSRIGALSWRDSVVTSGKQRARATAHARAMRLYSPLDGLQ
jgi:WD40 repeat protein